MYQFPCGMHKLAMFLLLFTLNISAVLAQSSTVSSASTSIQSTSATASSSLATIAPGSQSYTYLGCYNETTGLANAGNVRALGELGNLTTSDEMTVDTCLTYCASVGKAFAGLEYSRECWCAISLNSNAAKLPDADCSLTCGGDNATICGGPLRLTVYQRPKSGSSGARKLEIRAGAAVAVVLGLVIAFVLIG